LIAFNEQVASAGRKNFRWYDFSNLQKVDCGMQRTEQADNSKNHQRQSQNRLAAAIKSIMANSASFKIRSLP
jgi:hypothetical protein